MWKQTRPIYPQLKAAGFCADPQQRGDILVAVYQLQLCYFLANLSSLLAGEKVFELYGDVVENWWHCGSRRCEEGLVGQKDHLDHKGSSWD